LENRPFFISYNIVKQLSKYGGGNKLEENISDKRVKRFELIAPLLNGDIDSFERRRLRAQILESSGISERTLRRYLQIYRKNGYKSLADIPRSDKGVPRAIPEEVVAEAVKLRQELPSRSIARIIEILEGEKIVKSGEVARTSLNRHLIQRGYGAAQLRAEGKAGQPATRFERSRRNSLWQADLKYGPILMENGKKKKTFLIALIDDKTRMIMHAEFYSNQRLPILEDCFRKALLKFGKPIDILVDNGKIFVSKWYKLACTRFGIRHLRARPYSPQTKGKIESYNKSVSQFMREFELEPTKTLSELNRKFTIWLDEGYTHGHHESLTLTERDPHTGEKLNERKRTPYQAYIEDPAKVQYISSIECRDAFLWEESRTVDKTGCIKLAGVIFDVGIALIRKRVDVRYDPFDISVIEVWYDGKFQRKAEKICILEFTPKPAPSQTVTPSKPTHSRLLKVYEEKNKVREKQRNGALAFREPKEDKTND
jgi:transposase InsO family protein